MRSQITRWAPSSGSSSKARDSARHPILHPAVRVTARMQLALINLCISDDILHGSPGFAVLLGIISLSPAVQPLLQRRTINYLPNEEVAGIMYALVVVRLAHPWPAVAGLFQRQLNVMGAVLQRFAYEVHPYEVHLQDKYLPTSADAVMIFRVSVAVASLLLTPDRP